MKKLWNDIGFVPTSFELEDDDKTEDDIEQAVKDASKIEENRLPPSIKHPEPSIKDVDNYDGITIRNIPKTLDDNEIFTFLMNYGLPHDHGLEGTRINKGIKNTWVVIDGINPKEVQTLFNSIHFPLTKQKFFDVPLYCKALRNMTPTKKAPEEAKTPDNKDAEKPKIPGLPEADRLKKKRIKKKSQKNGSLNSPNLRINDPADQFEFSDSEDESEEESFEDSRAGKREAGSPADAKENKKSRPQGK